MEKHSFNFLLQSLGIGGAEKFHVRLANHLVSQGYTVNLILIRPGGQLHAVLDERVTVTHLNITGEMWKALPRLVLYLRRARPNCVMAVCTEPNLILLASMLFLRDRPRVVVNVRSNLGTSLAPSNIVSRRQKLFGSAVRRLYPRADWIITISEGVKQDLLRFIGNSIADRCTTILNSVDTTPPSPDDMFLHAKTQAQHAKIVVACGTLKPAKGFDTLLRAFGEVVNRRGDGVVLWIVGEGPLKPQLVSLAESLGITAQVWFVGYHPEPKSAFSVADLFVLSSRYEGLANVILEALAVGLPVVSTDCESGPREILAEGRYGSLVPVDDVSGLAEGVDSALDAAHDEIRLISRAKEFSMDKISSSYIRALVGGN